MSAKVYFISDLHLGHKKILQFSSEWREGSTVDEHDEWIINQWNSVVKKHDVVWLLGDVAFTRQGLEKCLRLNGVKKLVMGNHDQFTTTAYELNGFRVMGGIVKYKGFWLSHAPVHPAELRGCKNIHGHVHSESIDDDRYINVCVEVQNGLPRLLDDIRTANPRTQQAIHCNQCGLI